MIVFTARLPSQSWWITSLVQLPCSLWAIHFTLWRLITNIVTSQSTYSIPRGCIACFGFKLCACRGVQAARAGKLSNHIWKWAKGKTFWLASIGHWAGDHFDLNVFNPRDRLRVRISFVGLYAFGAVFFSLMFYYVGLIGIAKYWLLPWLLYHFLVRIVCFIALLSSCWHVVVYRLVLLPSYPL